MGPWVHVCEQCACKSYFQVSDMLLPQVACSHCGHVKIISTETIAQMRATLDQQKWYAGFLELILGLENELGIEFTDDDFPKPFVTWRQLLERTKERCGAIVQEEDIMAVMSELSSCPADVIREEIDQAIKTF